MSSIELILIALGLSMDAFAVSVTLGLSVQKPNIYQYLIPGLYFGFFQALMPAIGYFAGTHFAGIIQKYDHFAAFVILGFIGGKMLYESFSSEKEGKESIQNPFNAVKMLILAVATSIDALAVGITFALFEINIFYAVLLIGLVTFLMSIAGLKIGNIFGNKYKSKAEAAGGIILILLGLRILLSNLIA